MIGVGLTGLLALLALVIGLAALSQNATHTTVVRTVYKDRPVARTTPAVAPQRVTMTYKSDVEHGKLGADGKWHDAAVPAIYTVRAGASVTVTAINYDSSPHTFTSAALGVNETIPGGSASAPSQAKFTFRAPTKPGIYHWHCAIPCDPYSMTHIGFMEGYVRVA